ncbi:zinc knuckle CX2CX4HX4C containing protein [Tanacetum coccineum]
MILKNKSTPSSQQKDRHKIVSLQKSLVKNNNKPTDCSAWLYEFFVRRQCCDIHGLFPDDRLRDDKLFVQICNLELKSCGGLQEEVRWRRKVVVEEEGCIKAGFLDAGGGGKKKNNTHGEQPARKKDNTNGLGFGSGFSSLVDDIGTVHGQVSDMYDVNAISGSVVGQVPESNVVKISGNDPSNIGPISVTNSSSYANKLSPSSLTKPNLWKLDANVSKEASYDVWLPLASVHEVFSPFNSHLLSVLIRGVLIFLNEWSPYVSLLKEELSRVPVWVKFHDVLMVAYTSDVLNMIASNIGTPMMLDSYTNSMCLESWGMSSYARILIEIEACNDF